MLFCLIVAFAAFGNMSNNFPLQRASDGAASAPVAGASSSSSSSHGASSPEGAPQPSRRLVAGAVGRSTRVTVYRANAIARQRARNTRASAVGARRADALANETADERDARLATYRQRNTYTRARETADEHDVRVRVDNQRHRAARTACAARINGTS